MSAGWAPPLVSDSASIRQFGGTGDGNADDSAAARAALAAVGRLVLDASGTWRFNTPVDIPTGKTVECRGVMIPGGAMAGFFTASHPNIAILGNGSYQSGGAAAPFLTATAGADSLSVIANLKCSALPAGTWFLNCVQLKNTVIGGHLVSVDSMVVHMDRCNDFTIRDIHWGGVGVVNMAAGNNPILCNDTTAGGTVYRGWNIEACRFDGNGVFQNALVALRPSATSLTRPNGVGLRGLEVRNTGGTLSDGIDALGLQKLTIVGCFGDLLSAYGLSVAGCVDATVTGCNFESCGAAGFNAGDDAVAMDTTGIRFVGCQAWQCGSLQAGAAASGFYLRAPVGHAVADVELSGCFADNNGVAAVLYGLGLSNPGNGITNVRTTGSHLVGNTGPILDLNPQVVIGTNTEGVGPVNYAAVGGIPANGPWTFTNTSSQLVFVLVRAGASASVSLTVNGQNFSTSQSAAIGVPVPLMPGEVLSATYPNGSPPSAWLLKT